MRQRVKEVRVNGSSPRPARRALALAVAVGLAVFTGCRVDSTLRSDPLSAIAVVAGDFDNVASPLNRYVVPYQTYQGIISTPVWDPTWDYEAAALTAEGLLQNEREMFLYDAIFIASGTRGLGSRQYNGLDPDDHLLTDPAAAANVRSFVQGGGRLLLTDWSYDLFEAAWPDAADFLGEDTAYDAAQLAVSGEVIAQVVHPELEAALGAPQLTLTYDYSNWAVPTSVAEDVDVLLVGSASHTVEGETDPVTLEDLPLAFSWQPPDARGRVLFLSFHVDAQPAGAVDELIAAVLGDFKEATGETIVVD